VTDAVCCLSEPGAAVAHKPRLALLIIQHHLMQLRGCPLGPLQAPQELEILRRLPQAHLRHLEVVCPPARLYVDEMKEYVRQRRKIRLARKR